MLINFVSCKQKLLIFHKDPMHELYFFLCIYYKIKKYRQKYYSGFSYDLLDNNLKAPFDFKALLN